jgi:hypothetical protein
LPTRSTSSKTSLMVLTYFGPGRCEGMDRFTEKLVSRLFLTSTLLFEYLFTDNSGIQGY